MGKRKWEPSMPPWCSWIFVSQILNIKLDCACVSAKLLQSCPTLCDLMDYSSPVLSVHGILQARILEWVALPSSRGSSQSRDQTHISCNGRQVLYPVSHLGNPRLCIILHNGGMGTTCVVKRKSEVSQSCLTLCDPVDCSLPGSSVHGIHQARVMEWVAISFSRGSSQPRDRTRVSLTAGRRFTIWATLHVIEYFHGKTREPNDTTVMCAK